MKIELRAIKHLEKASRDTFCFTADVWIDGVKAGEASNDGNGGCNRYQPRALQQRLDGHARTLSTVMRHGRELQPDGDQLVFDLVADWLCARDLKALLRRRIVFMRDQRIEYTHCFPAVQLASLLAPAFRPALLKRLNAQPAFTPSILNDLPFEDALAIYRKAVFSMEDKAAA